MNEDIKKILEISVNAPSGSNSQPWRFKVRGNIIQILAMPEKDHPVLNFRNRGTLVAFGALIENILIIARSMGYEASFNLLQEKTESGGTISEIILEKSEHKYENDLAGAVSLRATNRKPYKNSKLTGEQINNLLNASKEIGEGDIRFTDNRDELQAIGRDSSVNEIIMLENQELHKLFFNEIVWSEKEEKAKGSGLYLETMELKPPQRMALKFLCKRWPIMSSLNKLGFARFIANDNAKNYSTCSAMGAIVVNDDDHNFILAGRLLERVWLKAISMGLSLHLLTGTLFLWQNVRAGKKYTLSEEHSKMIEEAYNNIAKIFKTGDEKLVGLVFRVGYGGEPSARSIKNYPIVDFIN